jgi:hypothetical protein
MIFSVIYGCCSGKINYGLEQVFAFRIILGYNVYRSRITYPPITTSRINVKS